MKYAFFHIPASNLEPAQSELNRFLAQHRIRDVSREFVNHREHSAWRLCVIYDESQPSTVQFSSGRPACVDYREVLSPEDFDVFSPLRKRRNELANAAGIPAYSVFSNEQLATMVRQRVVAPLSAVAGGDITPVAETDCPTAVQPWINSVWHPHSPVCIENESTTAASVQAAIAALGEGVRGRGH